ASWPEEIVVRGNLENISKKVDDAGIKKTAMIVVGPVLDPGDFKASKLYDATFKHEYRDSE
ncbi:MAG: cobalt-precorrin-4 C(11)-methyltransferase, partial [Methanobacteriaceae archaeon]|nr:cobalt-precorrin-4 C(11)-methyltransferase [Methanobacteriaceae archaeon]